MKYVLAFVFMFIFSVKVFADDELISLYTASMFNPDVIKIENVIKTMTSRCGDNIMFTRVPRGLVVSVAQSELFNNGRTEIKPCGLDVLNAVIKVLHVFSNRCVIESHTDELLPVDSPYKEVWEVSIIRANRIADYIVKKGNVPKEKVFPLGFGDSMPFKETVSQKGFTDCRIDFVIIDYELYR